MVCFAVASRHVEHLDWYAGNSSDCRHRVKQIHYSCLHRLCTFPSLAFNARQDTVIQLVSDRAGLGLITATQSLTQRGEQQSPLWQQQPIIHADGSTLSTSSPKDTIYQTCVGGAGSKGIASQVCGSVELWRWTISPRNIFLTGSKRWTFDQLTARLCQHLHSSVRNDNKAERGRIPVFTH